MCLCVCVCVCVWWIGGNNCTQNCTLAKGSLPALKFTSNFQGDQG